MPPDLVGHNRADHGLSVCSSLEMDWVSQADGLLEGRSCCGQDLEEFWLGSTPYVAGEHISLADLPTLTELETLRLLEGAVEVCPCSFRRYVL